MFSEKNSKVPVMPREELSNRLCRFRSEMEKRKVDVLIFTSYVNFDYIVGHLYSGWELHAARPMYVIISAEKFIVVSSFSDERLLELNEHAFQTIYYNGFWHEATEMVVDKVKEITGYEHSVIAIDYGPEIFGMGNIHLVDGLRNISKDIVVISGASLVWEVRKKKSEYEAELKRRAFAITDRAFDKAVSKACAGITEREMQRTIKKAMIEYGAERVDAMALKFGRGDFLFNQLPGERKLKAGDFIWGDFYNTYYGYPSDRCRIARCGEPEPEEKELYKAVRNVTFSLCRSVRDGQTCQDIYRNFEKLWKEAKLPPIWGAAGRIGHSSGHEVLEPISIAGWSNDIVESGMILHFEPKLEKDGGVYQFEEVIYVRDNDVEFLTNPSPEELPVVFEEEIL